MGRCPAVNKMRLPCGTTRVLALLLLHLVKANFRSWVQIGFGAEAEIRQLAGHPTSSSTLMLTDSRGGVFRTDDGGETWYPRWQRLPARLDLQGVSFFKFARNNDSVGSHDRALP